MKLRLHFRTWSCNVSDTQKIICCNEKEFRLLANIVSKYLPPEYPYDVVGGARTIKQLDFDDRVDIIPVADPNIFSMSQRITLAQTELQLQQQILECTTCIIFIETCTKQLV